MFKRFWYEVGRAVRETGQAIDRIGKYYIYVYSHIYNSWK